MLLERNQCAALWTLLFALWASAAGAQVVSLRTNDVVGFVGGSDVAAAQFSGHLEALLAVKFPGTRFRNFGWEGDTVFTQPRDYGFPPLTDHLQRAGVTVVIIEAGRAEALSGQQTVSNFFTASRKLAAEAARGAIRVVLVTPPPFEAGPAPLPDLSPRNHSLADHAQALRRLAEQGKWPVVDLFAELGGVSHAEPRLTDNGFQITPRGHGLIAAAWARQLGFAEIAAQAGALNEDGIWSHRDFEQLRQMVIEKNRLWFNYWRPQNWAFLGGDRTSQPSSRDHRDPKVRWFPAEMEKWKPLIEEKERQIEAVVRQLKANENTKSQTPNTR